MVHVQANTSPQASFGKHQLNVTTVYQTAITMHQAIFSSIHVRTKATFSTVGMVVDDGCQQCNSTQDN